MGLESLKFGTGPKELGGSVDLISRYRLWPHHEFFCKSSRPLSISETYYLHNVVGDRGIRKGDGMELNQLFQDVELLKEKHGCIRPFRLDVLADVFRMREITTASLFSVDRGTSTVVKKLKSKSKERHHKKHEKSKDHKKHKHQSKGRDENEVSDKSRIGPKDNGLSHLPDQGKKRRLSSNEYPSRFHRHCLSE